MITTRQYGVKRAIRKLILTFACRSPFISGKLRSQLVSLAGVEFEDCASCFIGRDVLIDDLYPTDIFIGNNTLITSGTKIITHHYIGMVKHKNAYDHKFKRGKVIIGRNCFIGMNTLIVSSVKIGNNSIIAAGSVVIDDVDENTIVAGNPAKKVAVRRDVPLC